MSDKLSHLDRALLLAEGTKMFRQGGSYALEHLREKTFRGGFQRLPPGKCRMGWSEHTHIYFIQGETTRLIKIGRAECVVNRLAALQHASPDRLWLLWCYTAPPEHEFELHRKFWKHRVRGEWFEPAPPLARYIRARKPGCFSRRVFEPDQVTEPAHV